MRIEEYFHQIDQTINLCPSVSLTLVVSTWLSSPNHRRPYAPYAFIRRANTGVEGSDAPGRNRAALCVPAVQDGGPSPMPFEELVEVMRVSFEVVEAVRSNA